MASKRRDYTKPPFHLTAKEQEAFTAWKDQYAPQESGYDENLYAAFRAGLKRIPKTDKPVKKFGTSFNQRRR